MYNVYIYNTPEDVKVDFGGIVTFVSVSNYEAFDIAKFAIEHRKAVSIIPVVADVSDSEQS